MTPADAGAVTVLSPHFHDFAVLLNEHEVDFVLVGGYALGVHGVIRATGDIDFFYRRTKKNVRRLIAAMMEFGAPPEVVDEEALLHIGTVMQFGTPPHRIDLLNAIDGVTFAEVRKGAVTARIDGEELRVIGLRELRKNKGATGRQKDKDDLRRLQVRAARKS